MWAAAIADICHKYFGWTICTLNKKKPVQAATWTWVLSQRRLVLFWSALLTQFLPVLHLSTYAHIWAGVHIWAYICLCVSIYSWAAAFYTLIRPAPKYCAYYSLFWGRGSQWKCWLGKYWGPWCQWDFVLKKPIEKKTETLHILNNIESLPMMTLVSLSALSR